MHPDNEAAVQEFLAETRKILDPIERLEMLETGEFCEEPDVKVARAWWAARYSFSNKKKTRTSDKFLWFLLTLKSWASTPNASGKKMVVSTYKEAFLSSETQVAIALGNRLEQEVRNACMLYVGTIDPDPGFFGFRVGKRLGQADVLRRIATILASELMAGVYKACAEFEHADVLVRGLWHGAEEVYPGIADPLEAAVKEYKDEQMRDFVRCALD
ncbi:MAG: hypothetical protein FWE19_07105 [Oscillospiraceae bacterium]|nr:hypothetical protein [Oscillospiraceae bacterium]